MKKICLSLGLCAMMTVAMAQNTGSTTRSMFYFGGGPTFSKFTGDGTDDASLLVGAQVALGMVWRLGNNFSLSPELNASMQGTKGDVPVDYTYRLWYLNLPVQVRYDFGQSGVYAETGPQIGLLLDAKRVINDAKTDVSKAYRNINVGWNVGLGYKITPNLAVNARVTPGLTDIAETSTSDVRQFTSALRLLFGF
ncbi:MAG TPA: porin family protein [Chitinophagaceae bacterium]|nr:porin family protein [Chitinophagaceae bacterium]